VIARADETKWTRDDVLEWIFHRCGVYEVADRDDRKLLEALLKCITQPTVRPVLSAELFKGMFTSERAARDIASRMEEAVLSLHEALSTAKRGESCVAATFAPLARFMTRCLVAVRAPFVYLTTHGLRTRSLELDIADHRKSCKLNCPVQDKVDVSVADMGGQVGLRANVP
jgi:hypothetical protein